MLHAGIMVNTEIILSLKGLIILPIFNEMKENK